MNPYRAWLIGDTIEKNKRIFKIPVYQRNYDWNNIQCEKLYDDIINAYQTQKKHFTGTIVYIVGGQNSSSLSEDLIIDGQQRITTVMILLKAMLDIAKENGDSIYSELNDLLFNRHCSEHYKLKLKPVKSDDQQFQALMLDNTDLFDLNSNVIRNYNLFIKLITRSVKQGIQLNEILEGMKQLEIVEIVLDKSQGDDPQVIFESINSTGLELSLADKIRNFVLMDDDNQDELFNKYWLPLENRIGNSNLARYFITYLDYKLTDSISESNAYSKFTKHCKENNTSHDFILQDLTKYARYYSAFIGRQSSYSPRINKYLHDIKSLDQSTLYPFLFSIFEDFENKVIGEDTVVKTLVFLRSYCVRRIVCEKGSSGLRGLYKTLYARLFKNESNYENYYGTIYTFFVTTNTRDKYVNDEEFKEALIHTNLYSKKKVCKFLLSSIENELSHEPIVTDDMSIEHILPQKQNAILWRKSLGDQYDYVYSTYLHTLGNLTITGYNSELGTKGFQDKKEYIETNSKAKTLNNDILLADEWDEEAILNRAQNLSTLLLDILKVEKVNLIDFKVANDNSAHSLEDGDNVSHTTPYEYIFYGQTKKVDSYANMLNSVFLLLYDLDSSIIEKLAKEKFSATSTDKAYISMDKNELSREKEIANTGIYFESNLSAKNILHFIKVLIEKHDLEPEEFTFFCN